MTFVYTQDGSVTLYDWKSGEHHHSLIGAYTEAYEKFIELSQNIIHNNQEIKILDLPFGLGYNLVALLKYLDKNNFKNKISCTAIEKDINIINKIADYPDCQDIHELSKYFQIINSQPDYLDLKIGDLRDILPSLEEKYNLIYYDPFSPRTMPELWTQNILSEFARLLNKKQGLFITYTASNKVRRGLRACLKTRLRYDV